LALVAAAKGHALDGWNGVVFVLGVDDGLLDLEVGCEDGDGPPDGGMASVYEVAHHLDDRQLPELAGAPDGLEFCLGKRPAKVVVVVTTQDAEATPSVVVVGGRARIVVFVGETTRVLIVVKVLGIRVVFCTPVVKVLGSRVVFCAPVVKVVFCAPVVKLVGIVGIAALTMTNVVYVSVTLCMEPRSTRSSNRSNRSNRSHSGREEGEGRM